MNPDLLYQLALTEVPYIGCVHAKILSEHFSSAREIFSAKKSVLEKIEGIGEVRAGSIVHFRDFTNAEKEMSFIRQYGISTMYLNDFDYPRRLLNCYDPPTLLFYKGTADLNASKTIAIVGTRNHTEYGRIAAERLVRELSRWNALIISGIAYGIDAIAHKAALNNGTGTVGVMAHGLDTIYPPENAGLARNMMKSGGLLTEFRSGMKPDKHHFPSRNRVVAGLCDALVIVESGKKGGSMITAEIAGSYHRDVFAIPGRTTDIKSAGCNELIRTNRAVALTEPAQLAELLGWEAASPAKTAPLKELFADLTPEEQLVLEHLQAGEELAMDMISARAGIRGSNMAAVLLSLEMKDMVRSLPGKRYRLTE